MHDMDPERHRPDSGAHRANSFIYRRIGEVIAGRRPEELIDDPNSRVFQDIDGRVRAIEKKGIEPGRISVVSALAHIHISGQRKHFVDLAGEANA